MWCFQGWPGFAVLLVGSPITCNNNNDIINKYNKREAWEATQPWRGLHVPFAVLCWRGNGVHAWTHTRSSHLACLALPSSTLAPLTLAYPWIARRNQKLAIKVSFRGRKTRQMQLSRDCYFPHLLEAILFISYLWIELQKCTEYSVLCRQRGEKGNKGES